MKINTTKPKTSVIAFFKGGHYYWFALGMAIAFCIHQMHISIKQEPVKASSALGLEQAGIDISSVLGLGSVSDAPKEKSHVRRANTNYCDWHPDDTKDCEDMLMSRLKLDSTANIKKRWLFLGDSTMKRLFERSILRSNLIVAPFKALSKHTRDSCWMEQEEKGMMCQQRMAQRCKLNEMFDLEYAKKWKMPDFTKFEGPLKYGLQNHYCTDCSGCLSNFLDCQVRDVGMAEPDKNLPPCERKRLTYGGYMSIEFARDVEMQSPRFSTTQENVAAYLHQSWNELGSKLLREWGLPICVINTGNHDAMVPGITLLDFIKNVEWYLSLFKTECSHFIWLSNTSPNDDSSSYVQTESLMRQYDDAVKILISKSTSLKKMTSFINVFDASVKWPKSDHIHMDDMWYHNLGKWLVETFMI